MRYRNHAHRALHQCHAGSKSDMLTFVNLQGGTNYKREHLNAWIAGSKKMPKWALEIYCDEFLSITPEIGREREGVTCLN